MEQPLKILLIGNSSDDLLTLENELKKGGYRFASRNENERNDIQELMTEHLRCAAPEPGLCRATDEALQGTVYREKTGGEKKQYRILTTVSNHSIGEVELGEDQEKIRQNTENQYALYRGVIENSLDCIAIANEDGRITTFNAAMEKVSGIACDKAMNMHLWDLQFSMAQPENQTEVFYHALKSTILHWCKNGVSDNEQTLFESEFVNKEGRRVALQSRIFSVKTHTGYCIGSISRDISEIKTLQAQLRESHEMYRTFLDSSSDLAFLKDRDNRYVMVNRSFLSHFNVTEEEVVGKTDKEFLLPDIYKSVRKTDESVLLSGGVVIDELQPGNGIFERRKFPVRFADGTTGIGGFIRNVTDLKEAVKEEARLLGGLKTLSDTAMDFVSMSYDEDLRYYISSKLREITRASVVIITSYDARYKKLQVESISGISMALLKKVTRKAGGHMNNISARITPRVFKLLMGQKLNPAGRSLPELIATYIGGDLSEGLQHLSGSKVYVTGLVHNKELFGVALVVDPDKNFNTLVVETFCKQASVALHGRRMLGAMQQSEQRFRNMFEKNKDVIFTMDDRWQVTSINPIGRKLITGKTAGLANIRQFMTDESFKRIRKVLMHCAVKEEPFCTEEVNMYTRNGSLLVFQVSMLLTYHNHKIAEVFGIARNITQNKMLQNEVLSKIIETEEREKRAFAEELHDGLGSLLSTINIYAGLLMKQNRSAKMNGQYLEQLRMLVHEAVNNVRQFANSLTPNVLNDFGMVAAIKIFCDRINNMHPGLVSFTETGNLKRFDRIVEINIYRITIEMINNTIKYCGALSLDISLSGNARTLKMGFVCKGEKTGLEDITQTGTANPWIRNIKARVNSLNGACDFRNEGKDNLVFIMAIPLNVRRPEHKSPNISNEPSKTKK